MRKPNQVAAIEASERAKRHGAVASMNIPGQSPAPMGPLKTAAMGHIKQPRLMPKAPPAFSTPSFTPQP